MPVEFESIRDLASVLPNAVEGTWYGSELVASGHVAYTEAPDEFEKALRVFGAELDRRTTARS